MAAVEDLDKILQSLWTAKPPGVTKSKIEAVTSLSIQNIQAEAQIVQKIASHYKNTPSTHKLGVLYVVDAVIRQWIEKARQSGQALVGNAAAPGTYAAGVYRMTEALPSMMTDLLQSAPEDQKEKIRKLIDIWERGNTFPIAMLAGFKQNMIVAPPTSNTPSGSPPSQLVASLGLNSNVPATSNNASQQAATAPSSNPSASAILAALASMGQQNSPAHPAANPASQNSAAVMMNSQLSAQPHMAAPAHQSQVPTAQYPAPQTNGSAMQAPTFPPVAPPQTASTLPPTVNALQGNPAAQIQFLQALVQNGYTVDQIAPIINALGFPMPPAAGQANAAPQAVPQPPLQVAPQPNGGNQNGGYYRDQERSNNVDYQERARQRSRSPDYKRRRVSPPNRRQSPVYGSYDPSAAQTETHRPQEVERRGRNRRGNRNQEYRQRTPPPQQRDRQQNGSPGNVPRGNLPKWIDWDHSIPKGHIKVLSRTLFVGGVSTSESQLADIFTRFGKVQTCMANPDKRHAFVKMENRQDAMQARQGIEKIINNPEIQSKIRSTRWGVGFGPRECCNYELGVSIIPINVLTDADRKWMLTAEFGGTGGKSIESGMVVEEPDIEIGAGVSSKAMSRRIGPELGGKRGGRHEGGGGRGRHDRERFQNREQHRQREVSPRPEAHTIGVPPPVPGFGFQLPGMPSGYR